MIQKKQCGSIRHLRSVQNRIYFWIHIKNRHHNLQQMLWVVINGWYKTQAWKKDMNSEALINYLSVKQISIVVNTCWSRGSVPIFHARGQQFEPRHRQYFKLLLDPGDFHSNPSRLLSFNISLKQCFGQ